MMRISRGLQGTLLLWLFLPQTMGRFMKYMDLSRMSEGEEHDFILDYLTWMKGSVAKPEILHVYNFGYDRTLPLPSIALTPDSQTRFNLQSSGLHTPSRWSIVIVGEKYLGRFQEVLETTNRIHEETQALPFAILVQGKDEIRLQNITSHMTPALVSRDGWRLESKDHNSSCSNFSWRCLQEPS